MIRRYMDDLGRVVIPRDIREYLGISTEDLGSTILEITVSDGKIIMTPIPNTPYDDLKNKIRSSLRGVDSKLSDLLVDIIDQRVIDNNKD